MAQLGRLDPQSLADLLPDLDAMFWERRRLVPEPDW